MKSSLKPNFKFLNSLFFILIACSKLNAEVSQQEQLDSLVVDDRWDYCLSAKANEQNLIKLNEAVKNNPNNGHDIFNLAQTYLCLGKVDEALKWYKKRIEKGGSKEEIWYSKYKIGDIYERLDSWDLALKSYMDALEYNADRAEPLQKITTYYRKHGKQNLAYLFGKYWESVPYPKDQSLLISHQTYDFKCDEEMSVCADYTKFRHEGFAAANRLVLNKNTPLHIQESTYRNMYFYVENLKNTQFQPIAFELPLIREGQEKRYNPLNPTICKTENGYDVVCRAVNYTQKGGKEPQLIDESDNVLRSKNYFLQYDRNLNLLSQREIVENVPRLRRNVNVQGLQDCRLAESNDGIYVLGAAYDAINGTCQTLCKLDTKTSKNIANVENFIPLVDHEFSPTFKDAYQCDKNWLPFFKDNELHIIYASTPFVIYKPDMQTGKCKTVLKHNSKHEFSGFRGAASPIKFDDGYLMMVQEVANRDQPTHMHRLVYLDKDFMVKKASMPFTFKHKGIENCCGMAIDHANSKLIATIGIEDREAYFCTIDLANVRSLLQPLPEIKSLSTKAALDAAALADASQEPITRKNKILVLIIASDNTQGYITEQQVWRTYMHLDPEHVEVYFIKGNPHLKTDVEVIGDVIWSKTEESLAPGILNKTIASLEYFQPRFKEFDYVVRTNLSAVYHFPRMLEHLKTLPLKNVYYGPFIYRASYATFVQGDGIIFSMDLANALVQEKQKLWDNILADDWRLGVFVRDKNVHAYLIKRMDFPTLAIWNANKDKLPTDVFQFRVKNSENKRDTDEIAIQKELVEKFYGIKSSG